MSHSARSRAEIARAAAAALRERAGRLAEHPAVVGFDGYIDTIIRVVDRRGSMAPEDFAAIPTIEAFAARCAAAAGKSANIEMHITEDRFGGNGPLMAGALGRLGMPTTYIGGVGMPGQDDALHPVFASFAERCEEVVCIGPPANTDALEFDDGKLMLCKPGNMQRITWDYLKERVGYEELRRRLERAALFGIVNWTQLGGVQGIFEGLTDELLPTLDKPPVVFIDLADPAKRTDEDVLGAMGALTKMDAVAPVILGLNQAESERIDRVLGTGAYGRGGGRSLGETVRHAAERIREKLNLSAVVIHPREGAGAAVRLDTGGVDSSWFDGPFTQHPKLSTGAGDHFNGGFAFARTLGLGVAESLATACAVSGCYVRDALSPDLDRLTGFLDDMPGPE